MENLLYEVEGLLLRDLVSWSIRHMENCREKTEEYKQQRKRDGKVYERFDYDNP